MVVAKLELSRRAHHSSTFDSPDFRYLQSQVRPWDVGAGRSKDTKHALPRIRRAAHNLNRFARPHVHRQDLELVCLRMLFCGHHLGDAEGRKCIGGVRNLLDLKSDRAASRESWAIAWRVTPVGPRQASMS